MRKVVWSTLEFDFPIALEQTGEDSFDVIYGAEQTRGLDYKQACTALGIAIMHALGCAGRIEGI